MANIEVGRDYVRMTMEMGNGDTWMIARHPELSPGNDFGIGVLTACCGTWSPVDVTRAEVEELVEALQDFLELTKEVIDGNGNIARRQ